MSQFTGHSNFRPNKTILISVLILLTINLFQSYFTGLIDDEAYYYYYSTKLAWGYYDHPPMIALLIRLGYLVFQNELGVRLFICLMSVASVMLIYRITEVNKPLLFVVVLLSIFIFQLVSFVAIPDSPLLFFTALFFFTYQRYLKNDNRTNALLVAISVAGLLYSKYLGILVIFFTFFSNTRLVYRKTFWMALLLSVVFLLPHFFWQADHNFPSLYFHLVERNRNSGFHIHNVFNYFAGQAAIFNPLIVFVLLWFAFRRKAGELFQKALQYNVAGIFLFGLLLSLNGNVEPNWTVMATIPLIILGYPLMEKQLAKKKTMMALGVFSLLLVFLVRLILILDVENRVVNIPLSRQVHGWKTKAEQLTKIAGGKSVVFVNSYQRASKYNFYTGNPAFTFNHLMYRKNQYDLSMDETKLLGKKVVFVHTEKAMSISGMEDFPLPDPDSLMVTEDSWYYKVIDNYYTYNFLPVNLQLQKEEFRAGTLESFPIEITNPLDTAFTLIPAMGDIRIGISFSQEGKVIQYTEAEDISMLRLNKKFSAVLLARIPEEPGKYEVNVSIRSGWLPPGINSRIRHIRVVEAN